MKSKITITKQQFDLENKYFNDKPNIDRKNPDYENKTKKKIENKDQINLFNQQLEIA